MINIEFDLGLLDDGASFLEITVFKGKAEDVYINNITGECISVLPNHSCWISLKRELDSLTLSDIESIFYKGDIIVIETNDGRQYKGLYEGCGETSILPQITIRVMDCYSLLPSLEYRGDTFFIVDETITKLSTK